VCLPLSEDFESRTLAQAADPIIDLHLGRVHQPQPDALARLRRAGLIDDPSEDAVQRVTVALPELSRSG
jgi:hypothetical protein